jgi:uncharacterized membrane protein YkgB
MSLKEKYFSTEQKVAAYLKDRSITLLKYSMAILYLWYGFLKVIGISPAEELVYRATHWIGVHDFVIFLGVWEMFIGLCLFTRKFFRLGLLLLFLQFPGTFFPIFLTPEDIFTVFPYGLTLEGQYVFKNLVLVSAGLILVGSLKK